MPAARRALDALTAAAVSAYRLLFSVSAAGRVQARGAGDGEAAVSGKGHVAGMPAARSLERSQLLHTILSCCSHLRLQMAELLENPTASGVLHPGNEERRLLQYTWGHLSKKGKHYNVNWHSYDEDLDFWLTACDARGRPLPPTISIADIGVGKKYRVVPIEEHAELNERVVDLNTLPSPGEGNFSIAMPPGTVEWN